MTAPHTPVEIDRKPETRFAEYCLNELVVDSLIEIGRDGRLAAEAARRGVARVVSVGNDSSANLTGSESPLVTLANISRRNETFDVVGCFGLLENAPEPIGALRALMHITRRRLVFDVPLITWRNIFRGELGSFVNSITGAPAILLPSGNADIRRGAFSRRFSKSALRMIFNRESVVFNPIRINSAHGFQPATVIAEKWRIRHMIVICAPTSGGKSTIAERLCKDPDFRQRFGLEDVQWTIMKAEDFFLRPREIQQNVIVMYNLLRRRNKKIDPQSEDPLLEIFCAAEHLTIITLLPTPERLRVQFERGEVSDPTRRYSPKILSLLKSYQDDTFLADWYRAWFEYSESLAPGHSTKWLVKFTSDEGHISDTSGWRKIVAEFYGKLVDSAP